jgi:hypothetical protein
MWRAVVIWGVVIATLTPCAARAQDTVDGQLWAQVVATVRLSENWRLHLEEQPRWYEDVAESFQVITRAGLGRQLNSRTTLWGGYAWVAKPPGPGTAHEHRVWEQLSATFPEVGRWTPSLRIRLEQRFQESWGDNSHRLRLMGRAVRPLGEGWSLVGWDEFMVSADDTAQGPWQGVDQNRLFAGALRQFSPKVGVEFGYLWTTSKPPPVQRSHAHVAFLWLNLTL